MSRLHLIYIVSAFLYICTVEASRILAVVPTPSISHQVVFRPLLHELAKRGHEVVVITPDPAFPNGTAPGNLTEIDIHDLSYDMWRELFLTKKKGTTDDTYNQFKGLIQMLTVVFSKQLEIDGVQKLLQDKTKTFDLLFIEACVRPALSFSHLYKAPVILISSLGPIFGNEEIIGAPVHPVLYPSAMRQKLNNLTIWEKITELYMHYSMSTFYANYEQEENEMLRSHFGADFPGLNELKNNVDMMFLNVNPIWQGNRPVPPSVVYMGGMHLKPQKELPQDLKSFFDSSKNGVIYVSFGTNVQPSLLPPEKIRTMVQALSKLPYDVLWKWDKDELPGRTKNIRISKWFPQSDLLRHPKIKLFVTQGGLQSTDEAITAGVPLVGIPMLADQWYNVEKYVQHKIGVRIDMDSITEENFIQAIKTIINNESYRHNILKMRELMNDQPQPPLERAIWWTEHLLRRGNGRHLRSPAANMTWAEYLELEIVLVVLLLLLTLSAMFVKIASVLIRYVKFIKKVKEL